MASYVNQARSLLLYLQACICLHGDVHPGRASLELHSGQAKLGPALPAFLQVCYCTDARHRDKCPPSVRMPKKRVNMRLLQAIAC